MNAKLVASCLMVGVLAFPVFAHAAGDADADRSSPKDFVKDSAITTKIKARMAKQKMSSLVRVQVDTDNKGMVVLSGTVEDKKMSDTAVKIARAEKGVKSVTNNIKVVPSK